MALERKLNGNQIHLYNLPNLPPGQWSQNYTVTDDTPSPLSNFTQFQVRLWPQNEIWFLERNTSEAKRDNLRMEFHLVVLKVLSQTTTAWDHVVFHWQRRNWSRWSRSPAESPHVCFCRMARFKSCCVPRSPRSKIYLNRIVAWHIVINSWQKLHQSPNRSYPKQTRAILI